ncbi:MAG: hypothetical protein ACPGJS_03450 [Flammeovirgaceae bacterium]
MSSLKQILLLSAGIFLLFIGNTAHAQTFYRFEITLSNNTVKTLMVDQGAIRTRTLANATVSTHVEERFILKQHTDGYCYIASATDQRLFLKRSGNSITLAELNSTSNPSNDYKWQIIYAGGGNKGCLASHNLSQLLKVNTNGSLQMINYASGSGGNIKFTLTKVTNNL